MPKFKVGDKVRIKDLEWWEKEKKACLKFIVESFNNSRVLFDETMIKYLGKEAVITRISDYGYIIDIDGYGLSSFVWGEEILEPIEDIEDKSNVDWEQIRIQASIAAMRSLLSNSSLKFDTAEECAKMSVMAADALIDELKKKRV